MLKEMTSETAEADLEKSLGKLVQNIEVEANDSYDELYSKWYNTLTHDLDARVEKDLKVLRHP